MQRVMHILTGPTAVGKTEWALRWAEARGAEIISCDSLLFYRGMDLGTAKPSAAERERVPHHLIDVCAVTERVTVVDYAGWAQRVVAEIESRGRPVLVVGGSGFYLRSFFSAVGDDIAVPEELRSEGEQRLAREGLASLVEELRRLNPAGLGTLDVANPRRVLRALERCRVSGRTLADLADAFARKPSPFGGWALHVSRLDCDPALLNQRIAQRVQVMLSAGLLEEVAELRGRGLESNPSAAGAIGYRESLAVLLGTARRETLAEDIARNTRALVKKQRTWFKTQLPSHRTLQTAEATVGNLFDGPAFHPV